jgi:hypothetical protein
MINLTFEQKQALKKLYTRQSWDDKPTFKSYLALRRAIVQCFHDDCIMIDMGHIWLGIEPDGYTHS